MSDPTRRSLVPDAPGVIVVVERPLSDLLAASSVEWTIQERQPSIAAMWDSLSGGRLDQHSRVLVFSDSLAASQPGELAELSKTARAIVAMAHAGAHVFLAVWRPPLLPQFQEMVADAARAQGIEPRDLGYHLLPLVQGGRAVLESMRRVLEDEVDFPAQYPAAVDGALSREAFVPSPVWSGNLPTGDAVSESAPVQPPTPVQPAMPVEPPTPPFAPAAPEAPPVARLIDPIVTVAPVPVPVAVVPLPEPEPAPVAPIPPPAAPAGPPHRSMPSLPPLGATGLQSAVAAGYPPSASMELLGRPKLPGQTTITVTSSKGGSGKSTVSILLAGSMARASADAGRPLSVCLIDLDTRDGQVASLIGKFMPTALNIRVQPVWDEERIRRNLVHADGLNIDCLLAPIRPRTADTVGPDFFRTIVRSLQRMFDIVVMDTSVQYLEPLIADVAMREADEILFVTTLASTAVQGMARALREITAPIDESGLGVPREVIGIIVNQSVADVGMGRDQVLAAGLGVPVVGVVPLATKDVLTATNLNRMHLLLDHPLIGPAYNELARACLPGRELAAWRPRDIPVQSLASSASISGDTTDEGSRRKGLFRR
jgi:cellulose biosynthesis protein BcsQ